MGNFFFLNKETPKKAVERSDPLYPILPAAVQRLSGQTVTKALEHKCFQKHRR